MASAGKEYAIRRIAVISEDCLNQMAKDGWVFVSFDSFNQIAIFSKDK